MIGAMAGADFEEVKKRISALFAEMHVDVPSVETDLFDSGILDSQRLVELLFQLEQKFKTQVDIEDFEIENFRCIETIATLIYDRMNEGKQAELSKMSESTT